MNWCRVFQVLCVIGKYDRVGNVTKEYHAVLDARRPGVCYFVFPVNNSGSRKHHQAVFNAMDRALASSQACLFFYIARMVKIGAHSGVTHTYVSVTNSTI